MEKMLERSGSRFNYENKKVNKGGTKTLSYLNTKLFFLIKL